MIIWKTVFPKKTDAEKLSVNNLNNYLKNSVSAVGSSRFNENLLKLEDETSLTDEMKALADQLKTLCKCICI